MKKYIGITIGPIFDMMNLVSTPAALWATSYLFSTVSKKTCEKLCEKKIRIISPFFDTPDNELFNKRDGVGLFHDRIILEGDESLFNEINTIRDTVLKETGESFGLREGELNKRVLFAAALIEVEDGENPILKGGKILDSLELPGSIVFAEEDNPILNIFTGVTPEEEERDIKERKKGKNALIKEIAEEGLEINPEKWPMIFRKKKSDSEETIKLIKSLPLIANAARQPEKKKCSYYAVVRSDGDNMSKIIERLDVEKNDESDLSLTDFSCACLSYCAKVAEKVVEYKGVPIYSSGDDLLAIMPCDSGTRGTVFNFMDEVNKLFNKMFDKYIKELDKEKQEDGSTKSPSLSFGVSICYKKFPLYEALEDSRHMLFDVAKSRRNCSAVRLQKHSGQSEGILIFNDGLADFLELHDVALGKDSDNVNEILFSALYKTEMFEEVFSQVQNEDQIFNLFANTFDSGYHDGNDFLHKNLPKFLLAVKEKRRILALSDKDPEIKESTIEVFNFVLRMLKFFVEKNGRELTGDE